MKTMMKRKDSMVLGSVCLVAGAVFATAPPAQADIFFFDNEVDFDAALAKAGKVLNGFEEFPWLALPGQFIGVDDPLDVNTSIPGWIEPGVLLDNVTYQSNLDPFGANGPNPRGLDGLALFMPAAIGATDTGLVANFLVDSFDILLGPPLGDDHTAAGMQLTSFNNSFRGSSLTVSVYDENEILLGTASGMSAPASQGGAFLGVLVTGGDTIGRINVYDVNPGFDGEGLYSIRVTGPPPPKECPADLDGSGDVGVKDLLILLGNWGPCP